MRDLRGLAARVPSERHDAQDVTEEYVDLNGRLHNLAASEQQYLSFMTQTKTIAETIQVQQQLTSSREQIERLQARALLLERTSATSLITITVTLRNESATAGTSRLERA